jgi:TrmH family RNA methyltransferase
LKPTIESLHNPRIKQVAKLRDAATRRQTGRFLIDGWREIELALQAGVQLESIFVSQHLPSPLADQIQKLLQYVSPKVLERISYGQRHDLPVALALTPAFELASVAWQPPEILLVLDRTEKPGNLGACLRTASAAGVSAVILTDPVCEPCNPNTIRASRGCLFSLPLAVTTRSEFQAFCRQHQITCFTARVDAPVDMWQQDFSCGAAIVFGSEAHGLGPEWDGPAMRSFSIPMHGTPDSLNLSISSAITLYEAVRQRRTNSEPRRVSGRASVSRDA